MIKKVVIPAAGLGIRLLPATKEQPKEMLPIFSRLSNGRLCIKPFLQLVFETLYDTGFREFCFVVRRGKRSIEDYFTLDSSLIEYLSQNSMVELANEMDRFYDKLRNSKIVFVNQPEAKGFGDAVSQARPFTGEEDFLVHAGDDLLISAKNHAITRMIKEFEKLNADVLLYVNEVEDPRQYGVINGRKIGNGLYQVKGIKEKPTVPLSKLAIIATYAFSEKIYEGIKRTSPDVNNEIQLTDAIQHLIEEGYPVYALLLRNDERRIDIGTPESYHKLFRNSFF
ncbi:MAG: UTP--glucose-1-phosphate uridylyltransferase [Promethearchaeota archaeon]|jgi:UTP--glucose-1-phosphate uridylyltransferase